MTASSTSMSSYTSTTMEQEKTMARYTTICSQKQQSTCDNCPVTSVFQNMRSMQFDVVGILPVYIL